MERAEPRLQYKLLAWLLGPLMVLLVLDTVFTYWTSVNISNLAHDRSLHEIAREVVLHVRPSRGTPKLEMSNAAERILLVDQQDRLFYRVNARDGTLIGGDPALQGPQAAGPDAGKPRFYDAVVHGVPVRMISAWMPYDGDGASGTVLVHVAETLNKRNRLALEILANVVVPQLLLIVMAAQVVYFGISRGLRPLLRLQAAVSNRSHLDLSPVDTRNVPGEVMPLVTEVNELMLRLGKTLNFQNRFIADAAHQLKTPVSGLKAQIELALREDDPARVRHSLAQLYVSADRLSRLVRQLLSLARNEPGAVESVELQAIDLNALAVEVAMDWVPVALKRDIDLGFEAWPEPVVIDADADRLRELINNLVDNAVRYSQEGGRVTVAVGLTAEGQGRLSVSDDGPHIPVDERTRIFERFHRLLGSHADGSGLGLAIVSEIAALHDARITLEEDRDGIGNTFSVVFPAPAPEMDDPPAA
ncbi:sensor histidine kinase [Ramlibacter sp. WS9]|uniref:sensor histidine kinase n=1 Tax=Ramlibacter sp. WS9 TaxID=1882741 RepID=UPI00114371D0|nr:sensor histidine kinase [Ramlibacter sp. WS9]ROZ76569.1 sensor histidine kinase [Ramlibacter sp. WS9]